jgi:hypothetical protein
MKVALYAVFACAVLAGCSYHETVTERPSTAAVVVPTTPPPPTVVVPED